MGLGLATALLDLVYPPRCAACGEPLESSADEPFCSPCAGAVLEVPPGCPRCGKPGPEERCAACWADPPGFEAVRAAGLFGGPLADAIHALKYRDRPALARPLGAWLARRVPLPARPAAVAAVPLGHVRRRQRCYDQAALLARHLARAAGLPLLAGALQRHRETPPQVGLTRAARAANVAGAFTAGPAVRGWVIVLVDDVVTTGATADACAQALRLAGAGPVVAVALGRVA